MIDTPHPRGVSDGIETARGVEMEIMKIETAKKRFLELLLLADEQEDMIDRYLDRGTMYVLEDQGIKGACVVTDEGEGILELKNLEIGRASCRERV